MSMGASVQDTPSMTPTATDRLSNRPACLRLPIIPAIPRKLERKPRHNSSMVVESRSARSAVPQPPAIRPILRTDGDSRKEPSDKTPQDQGIRNSNREGQPEGITVIESPGATAPQTALSTPASATAEDSLATSPAIPSALDPQTPPFVPEASRAPLETVEIAECNSNLDNELDVPSKQTDPQVQYPLQTTTSWMSYQTPPDDSVNSSIQHPEYTHGHPTPLFYDPAAPYNHPNVNPAVYYGYGHSHGLSFYPQSSQSYASASPVQSSYEGYAIATTPHVSRPRPDAPSYQRHASSSSIRRFPNPPGYPSYQPQVQYPPSLPQFGSHLPITPSATPPSSGSHKQAPSPTDEYGQDTSAEEHDAVDSHDQDKVSGEVSQNYKDWCDRTVGSLKEEMEASVHPSILLNHLTDNFNNPVFADCELYISHVSHRFEPVVVSLHSLLIAQNPKLKELLQSAEIREDGKKQILLAVEDQYTTPGALKIAIKVCYGERLTQYIGYPGDLTSEAEISRAWMEDALALAAAGHLLGMTGVAHRGEQIASVVLDWHNLEQALSFAMDTNVARAWGSSDGSLDFPRNEGELLLSCLTFVVGNISENTILDLAAKSLPSIDRLPVVPDTQPQSSRSRLSKIQFGDLRLETPEIASEHDVLVSRILVSLSFVHFQFILDRIPVSVNCRIANAVIEEREKRRLRALDAKANTTEAILEDFTRPVHAERLVEQDGEGDGRLRVEESQA